MKELHEQVAQPLPFPQLKPRTMWGIADKQLMSTHGVGGLRRRYKLKTDSSSFSIAQCDLDRIVASPLNADIGAKK